MRAILNLIEYENDIKNALNPYGRGVIPDYEVKPNQDNLYKGIDTELKFIMNLIKNRR